MADQKKKILAVSKAYYRGYAILETPGGFVVQLGPLWYSSKSLPALTKQIDEWLDLKKN